ncbi:translocation/assembly module TamB domain-containing protein [Salinarimonas soli]|uniref:Translocation and assembly module TamB C-terminal domain-containing protein n=1 Tax=Salinarimonas soli TaxID=1638099 RepID=A0A5B2VCJ9_9HYPH|nr:translocation/assembly module TamB domain-containing protein [Salinarimonas soli]KAA2236039.1 hypothetical protein F0L46_16835 [Salinarimonas soli]
MRLPRLLRPVLAGAVALLALAVVVVTVQPGRAQTDQGVLAGLISRLLSTPATRVSIGAVEGVLSSNAVIRDIRISDRDGVWLSVDRARLNWSRTALLRGRLQVDALEIDRIDLPRRPLPAEGEPPPSGDPILPELPVKVVVERFALGELALGAPVLGTPARLQAQGRATLGAPSEGLDLVFAATRRDAPGRLSIELAYVPQTARLRLDLVHDEPAGGLAARLLDLPGLPPVALKASGEGPLGAFAARLDFTAGPTIGAQGEARIARAGTAYRATLGLAAQIAGLVPPAVAPVFAGTTRLDGGAAFGDDGSVRLEGIGLASSLATLDVNGTVAPDRTLDLRVAGRALPEAANAVRPGEVALAELSLDLALRGPPLAPRVDGTIVAGGVRLPDLSLDRLDARLASSPEGNAATPDRFRFEVTADARGLALKDRDLGRAVGLRASLKARGTVDLEGVASVESARIETPTGEADFEGRVGTGVLAGTVRARLPSLEPLSGLAGSPLRGSARLTVGLTGSPSRVAARVDGELDGFSSRRPALDGLVGRSVTLAGLVRRLPDGFAVEGLRVNGANVEAVLDGRATAADADLGLRLSIPDLARLDPAIQAGRARVEARLTGGLDRPDVTATARLQNVRALDRPIPRLDLEVRGTDLTGALSARVSLDGEVSGKRAAGRLAIARPSPSGPLRLDDLDLAIGSVTLRGGVGVGPDGLATGQVALKAGNLDDLSPLVLTRLAGSIDAAVALSVREGVQVARIDAKGARLRLGTTELRALTADVEARDPLGQPRIDGRIAAESLAVAGQTFSRVRLEAQSRGASTAFDVTGAAQGFDLEARGTLTPAGTGNRVDLAAFQARRGAQRLSLANPASLVLDRGSVRIADLTLALGSGRLTVAGTAGAALDLDVRAVRVPLAAAEIVSPGLGLSGTLDGTARVTGTAASPTGTYQLAIQGLVAPQLREAGLGPLTVRAEGRLLDERASVQASIDAPRAGRLEVTGSVPLAATGNLDLAARGRIDLAVANAALGATGQRLAGNAAVDLAIRGDAARPDVTGAVTLEGAAFDDPLRGIRITGIRGRLAARGDNLVLEGVEAATPNGGTLAASGRVTLDPGAGFPGEIAITGRRAQLASGPEATAVADLDLTLGGPLARSPRIAGRIDLVTLDLSVPDRLPTTQRPLPGTRHVAPPPQAAARLKLERRRRDAAGGKGAAPFAAALDLTIVAQNRIFVRGRGIEAELGGELRLTGTTRDVAAVGAFDLRRGRLDILGQRLSFTRGRLDFTGDLTPSLDFVAETQAADITARIAVTGPASRPDFAITSDPDLPQDEVLSRLLFRRAAGGLTPGQALQLAQAVATLSGGGGGAFEQLRRSLGVDSLDITTGAGGGPAIGASRYISDRLRVGVRAGTRPEETGVTVDVDITRRLKLQGEAGADGSGSVGIAAEWEY